MAYKQSHHVLYTACRVDSAIIIIHAVLTAISLMDSYTVILF